MLQEKIRRRKYLETCSAQPTATHWSRRCKHGCVQQMCASCFNICAAEHCKCTSRKIHGVICLHLEQCFHFGCCPEEDALRCCVFEECAIEDHWTVVPMTAAFGDTKDVDPSSPAAEDLVAWFMSKQLDSYTFRLQICRAFSLSNSALEHSFKNGLTKLKSDIPNIQRLFHGTSLDAVKAITSNGFQLPRHHGMFGRGVYFAGTPQKSWQYCIGARRYMLVCDVALGRTLEKNTSDSCVEIQRTSFDSVTGLARPHGTLTATEYVIYDTVQVLPIFLLEVTEVL